MIQAQGNGRPGGATRPRSATGAGTPPATQGGPPSGQGAGMVSRIGPLEIDWPRSLGYFGGIALAVGIGMIDPPVGLFIAVVPFLKMLDLRGAPTPSRFVGQVIEGMAKPVGGDSQGTVRLVTSDGGADVGPVGQPS